MATITAKTPTAQICLLLITVIVAVSSNDNSVLTELYKQAARENRPLILVVDNHEKKQNGQVSKSISGSPFVYLHPPNKMSSQLNVRNKKNTKPISKQNLLKQHLQRLRMAEQHKTKNNNHSPSKLRNSRNDVRDRDERYKSNRGRYRSRYDDRHRDRYGDRHHDHYYDRHHNRYDDRYRDGYVDSHHDREDDRYHNRHDRDGEGFHDRHRNHNRFRYDKNRDYKLKGRYQDNRYDDRDRYRDDDRDNENNNDYGTSVLSNLLRISNDLNCEALNECKVSCKYGRIGKKTECESNCKEKYHCEHEKFTGRDLNANRSECGDNGDTCGEDDDYGVQSTRGPNELDDGEPENGNNGNGSEDEKKSTKNVNQLEQCSNGSTGECD